MNQVLTQECAKKLAHGLVMTERDVRRVEAAVLEKLADNLKDADRYAWLIDQCGFGIRRNGVIELSACFSVLQPDHIKQLGEAIDAQKGQ